MQGINKALHTLIYVVGGLYEVVGRVNQLFQEIRKI